MELTLTLPDDLIPIGTVVHLPRPALGSVETDEILGYNCILEKNESGLLALSPTDYRLNTDNTERAESSGLNVGWKSEEFFLSYEAAKSMAREYRLQLSDTEWNSAIGFVKDEDGYHFDNKLSIFDCCSATENIRTMLGQLAWTGKISAVNREILKKMLELHTGPDKMEGAFLNDRVLSKLGLEWEEDN